MRRNGGVQGRPGSSMILQTLNNSFARLIPYVYSKTVAYMMEFGQGGNGYIRFYQNGVAMLAQGAAAYNNATNYKTGDLVTSAGVTYIAIFEFFLNDPRLTGGTLSTFVGHAPPNATYWHALTNGVYEIPIPNAWAVDLANLRYDQSGNDMIFTFNAGVAGAVTPQMRLTRWQDGGGHDVFGIFNAYNQSYVGPASPTNNQGDSNVPTIAAATTVYAISAFFTNGDERPQIVNADGTNASIKGTDITTTNTVAAGGTPITINWPAVAGAIGYNIYKMNKATGVFGFLSETTALTFVDNGIVPDYANPWVQQSTTFRDAYGITPYNNSPACVAYYQQRLFYGNTANGPTTAWGSETGLYDNFNIHVPSLATDALNFKMAGAQDIIMHLVSLGTLLVFTYGSISAVNGDSSGAISPASINPHRESIHGASQLKPLIVGEFCLYAQSTGSIIRDLGFNFQVDGYRGDDLTIFATHLFDDYTIMDWTYAAIPHSIVWAVRSDGALLSLTYVREQQVMAWARHDTNGSYISVCSIPENGNVGTYACVKRGTNYYIEKFYNQSTAVLHNLGLIQGSGSDVRDYIGMDCSTTIDGRSAVYGGTMTLTGGTHWDETELLTLTRVGGTFAFTAGMATNKDRIFLYDASGNLYRFKITSFTSDTVVQGFLDRALPVSLQGAAAVSWAYAQKAISGLNYLEGYNVSVFGDGYVVGSPNNAAYPVYTVTAGAISLDKHYAVLHIGLPFITDIETLDIDTPGPIENEGGRMKVIGEVTIYMVNSRPCWVGGANPDNDPANTGANPLYRLTEQKVRRLEGYDSPISLITGKVTQTIQPDWDQNGHVFIRNVDPTPLLVSAISPEGLYPMRVG